MLYLRAFFFQVFFYLWTAFICVGLGPVLLAPRSWAVWTTALWARGTAWGLAAIAGITFELRGRQHRPLESPPPVLIASKHQSVWDTMVFAMLFADPIYVAKSELFRIPFYGGYLRKLGMIPVDRESHAAALKTLLRTARALVASGRSPLIVFPQGTRTRPGEKQPYLVGIAALYGALDVPVVPVALNSGLFWPRRRFLKYPGTITLEFLEPIAPGLDRAAFMGLLEERIESASAALEREARERFARHWS